MYAQPAHWRSARYANGGRNHGDIADQIFVCSPAERMLLPHARIPISRPCAWLRDSAAGEPVVSIATPAP